jgi:hypothetical protein
MRKTLLALLLLSPLPLCAQPDVQWVLKSSTLGYHVTHPLHNTDGVSHAARGKGVCHAGQCDFLIGAEVKSFDSGDSNRDLHMIQVVRGAQFPLVTVRAHLPEAATATDTFQADIDIEFAGQTAHYKQLTFHRTSTGASTHIVGTIPATLSDFKIPPPSFLMAPLRNEMPIAVDLTWERQ